eukprot:COSAG05_NODE_18743_length_303_cov_1.504902_1_plen_100_part_11
MSMGVRQLVIACLLCAAPSRYIAGAVLPPSPCRPMSLAVDGHRVRSAMAVAHRALFSWQLPTVHLHAQDGGGSSSAACARQSGYQVRITGGAGRVVLLDT